MNTEVKDPAAVTPADVEAEIAHCYYLNAGEAHRSYWPDAAAADQTHEALDRLIICVLVTRNGHTVLGEAHCQNPATFDAQRGRDAARQNAVAKLWPMVVYARRSGVSA